MMHSPTNIKVCGVLTAKSEAWLYLWGLQSCFIVYFWHKDYDWYPGYCSHLMFNTVYYSANIHHVARCVLEEASLKMGNKSVLKAQCTIIQHILWKKSKVYYFNHGTTGQKLYKTNHSEQRKWCGGEINLQCTIFQVIFTTHLPTHIISHTHHQMSARNVGSVCSCETNSWHTIPCTPKLTSASISQKNKLLCLHQAGWSHVVICNDLCKEVWMSDISSECPHMNWCNSNCYCSSISIYGRNFDTLYHKFKLMSKSDRKNQNAA